MNLTISLNEAINLAIEEVVLIKTDIAVNFFRLSL